MIPEPRIIARTPRWLVVDKPAGWLTVPGRPSPSGGGAAAPVLRDWAAAQAGAAIWVVHRIDRETSGVVLFALDADSHREANGWFERHEVRKTYECLAAGAPRGPTLKMRAPIEGAASVTLAEVLSSWKPAFLARVRPQSGRRHQIRIHFAGEGNPLLGDTRYGGPRDLPLRQGELRVDRVALHAARLELPTGETFESPWPEDFRGWVEALKSG